MDTNKIVLALPLRQIDVTQPFGVNYLDFYKKMGYAGHNGYDFRAMDGFSCYAAHGGKVIGSGIYSDGGIGVEIWHPVLCFKTIYYHLKDTTVKIGDTIIVGQKIGHCDNTGKYTTGNHLHFGMKLTDKDSNTLNKDNGYGGAIDPTPYFEMTYNGIKISNKDCYKNNAYHRYYRGRPNGGLINEIKVVKSLIPFLKRLPTNDEINACTYGAWDREAIKNPAMYDIWAWQTKGDLTDGKKPFQDT